MAGRVQARAYYSPSHDGLIVVPDRCPAADAHRKSGEQQHEREVRDHWPEALRWEWSSLSCSTISPSGERHYCAYWYGWCDSQQPTRRMDLSMIRHQAIEGGNQGAKVGCLCVASNRNVPPGG